jgi:hypothetical protein
MLATEVLMDGFDRVRGAVHSALAGAGAEALAYRPDPAANTIAWLAWHVGRIQDAQIAEVAGNEQVWTAGGWYERFGLPFGAEETGYGQTADEVAAVRADPELLAGYYDATHARTIDYLRTLSETDFARVVDTYWNPPVTLMVRLVSILADDLQHAGQAAYVRGMAKRAGL